MLVRRVTEALEDYALHHACQAISEFCSAELSAVYLDVLKDRLYLPAPDAPTRRAAQTTCFYLLETLTRLLAPVLSFTAEEIWQQLPDPAHAESVQLTDWPVEQAAWTDDALAAKWAQVLAVRAEVTAALARAQADGSIPQPLAGEVTLYAAGETGDILDSLADLLPSLFIVSSAEVAPWEEAPPQAYRGGLPNLAIGIRKAAGSQCERCRQWHPLGSQRAHPTLCARCASTVTTLRTASSPAA